MQSTDNRSKARSKSKEKKTYLIPTTSGIGSVIFFAFVVILPIVCRITFRFSIRFEVELSLFHSIVHHHHHHESNDSIRCPSIVHHLFFFSWPLNWLGLPLELKFHLKSASHPRLGIQSIQFIRSRAHDVKQTQNSMLLSKSVRNYCRFLLFSCSSGRPTSCPALPLRCHLFCQLSLLSISLPNQPEFHWLLTIIFEPTKQNTRLHDGVWASRPDQSTQLYHVCMCWADLFCLFSFWFLFVLFCFEVSTLKRSIRPSPPFYCDVRVNYVRLFEIFL